MLRGTRYVFRVMSFGVRVVVETLYYGIYTLR